MYDPFAGTGELVGPTLYINNNNNYVGPVVNIVASLNV